MIKAFQLASTSEHIEQARNDVALSRNENNTLQTQGSHAECDNEESQKILF